MFILKGPERHICRDDNLSDTRLGKKRSNDFLVVESNHKEHGGLVICSVAKGKGPAVPFVSSSVRKERSLLGVLQIIKLCYRLISISGQLPTIVIQE